MVSNMEEAYLLIQKENDVKEYGNMALERNG